ncbi:class I glutamine amidotransferase-like protein [Irpex rosettiformis]|uniref:Class I glutamine amidotransferase-like protein n=1 Tax=Irpex rosettiformis TaxID=378272 RepID=A0ACB8U7A2_9APHY|nr:class I glutamine amidotransferase-like protein [Irpex rosettiformis]
MSSTSLAQSNTTASALIYSATVDFRHDSILTAIEAMKAQGLSYNIQFDNTEDASWFTDDKLAQYDLLVFLMNTGEVLDNDGQTAFQRYIDKGGNFVGIHAASDCLRNSTFFDKELGSHFDYHPEITNATVDVLDHSHPSTSMLPDQWHVYDEMYNFKSDPRSVGATVVLSANESSYNDPGPRRFNQGTPHPTAWYQEHGAGADVGGVAGRSFYTSLGHTNDTWKDNLFLGHVMGGISWAVQSGTTRATNASALVGSSASSSHSSASTSASPSATTGSIPSATQASTAL